MSCVALPPPAPAPAPGPPPPAPAPVPAPPAPAPDVPPGRAQVVLEFSASYILENRFCAVVPYTFPDIFAANGKISPLGVWMYLKFKNLSPTTAGEVSLGVTADNAGLTIDPPLQTLLVPAGGYVYALVGLYVEAGGQYGTYVITLDTGVGTTTSFNLAITNDAATCDVPIEGGS